MSQCVRRLLTRLAVKRASGLVRRRMRIALGPSLVGFERLPVNVSVVVLTDENRPLGPVGVVARATRDFEAEHDADASERHLRGHVSETGSLLEPRAGDSQILVDDVDLIASPAERDRALDESVLPVRRLAVVLDLSSGRLSHVDEGVAGQVSGRKLSSLQS